METKPARICVPVCVRRASELARAVERATEVADIIELRLDYLPETELTQAREEISRLLTSGRRPMILTLRPAEFGGARPISAGDRLFFRVHHAWEHQPDFWDLEVDLALILQQRKKEGNDVNDIVGWGVCDWNRTICSYHDFVGVPHDLEQIYASMAATESRILKIAVQADDAIDCIPVFRLLERARREGREMIAIAMGPAGIVTRILGPSRGAFLTYGSLDDESATAPGQLTATELREVYRIDRIDRQTEIMGLIGRPVSHSLSPQIHNAAFAAVDRNAVYIPFEVNDAPRFLRRMIHPRSREIDWRMRGLSVTAPHKSNVIDCLDWTEPDAKEIGAVNTIVVRDDELRGYNTDTNAFIVPLRAVFGSLKHARCAIMGAGGVARAAVFALQREGADVELFARDESRARATVEGVGVECSKLTGARFRGFDIVVNATPVGTRKAHDNETLARAEQLQGVQLAYDLVYNPTETGFLREARTAGCETLGGLQMLIAQAAEQFKLWTGEEPNVDVMRAAALMALSGE
jgi:3-dehydroquinate dehydratase/shikimate dehydrogenase